MRGLLLSACAFVALEACQCGGSFRVDGGSGGGNGGAGVGGSGAGGGSSANGGGAGAGAGDTLVFDPPELTVVLDGSGTPKMETFQLRLQHAGGTSDPIGADQVFFDRPDLATAMTGSPVAVTVATAFAGTGTLTGISGTLHASALLHVRQEVTMNDGGIAQPIITALTAANLPADTAVTSLLYPYDHTVFPLGLASPLIMWTAPAAGDTYLLRLERSTYRLDTFFVGTQPGQIRAAQDRWDALTTAADPSDPLVVTLARYDMTSATAFKSASESWTITGKSLRGAIYYWTVSVGGHVARIHPGSGSTPQTLNGGTCMGCHAVSADGSKLVASVEAAPSNDSSASTARAWVTFDLPSGDAGYVSADFAGLLAINPDGKYVVYGTQPLRIADANTGARIPDSGIEQLPLDTGMLTHAHPAFSPDGKHLATVESSNLWFEWQPSALTVSDFDEATVKFSNPNVIARSSQFASTQQAIAYPTFSPDSASVVYHVGDYASECTGACDATTPGAGSLWIQSIAGTAPVPLLQLNNPPATADRNVDFEPTFNPLESGGYHWVVFTSMRDWGNKLQGTPLSGKKRLWVAAIDETPDGGDPSHPAFYLEGQEDTMNMRGYWTLAVCTATPIEGAPPSSGTCAAAFECCSGFCQNGKCVDPGPVACKDLGQTCTSTGDCCTPGSLTCQNGTCQPGIN